MKFNVAGIALRVPTPNVSVVDLVIQTEKKTFAEEVNEAFRESARGPQKVQKADVLMLVFMYSSFFYIPINEPMQ